MPQVKEGPKGLNSLLESVYSSCMKKRNNQAVCSMEAWTAAKNAGWFKTKDGKWKRKDASGTFNDILKYFEKEEVVTTQAILLNRTIFQTEEEVIKWLKEHSKKYDNINKTEQYWEARQRDPGNFVVETFKTYEIDEGIKLILGRWKE